MEQDLAMMESKKQSKPGQHIRHNHRLFKYSLIAGYLVAIVTANWSVSRFGPSVSIITAFLFIGLNITTRDYLHEIWQGAALKRNMFLLIATGSLLSLVFNAGQIALASFVAFAASETTDAVIYHKLGQYPRWLRINGSNVPSALVDSLIFPVLAFGWPPLWVVVFGQFAAKVFGGAIWSLILGVSLRPSNNGVNPTPTARSFDGVAVAEDTK